MATKIKNPKLFITRGDTPTLDFSTFIGDTDQELSPSAGEFHFRAKRSITDTSYAIDKVLVDGRLSFAVEDTVGLAFGNYIYEVELVTASGYHETYITAEDGQLTIGLEVENHA